MAGKRQRIPDAVVAADVGGTNIRATEYLRDGDGYKASTTVRVATPQTDDPTDVLVAIRTAIFDAWGGRPSCPVGICLPGPLNPFTGEVYASPNIRGFREAGTTDVRGWLERELGVSVAMDNDANCAGRAEAVRGAGKGYGTVVFYTWSTGVGGGVTSDGEVIYGRDGMAAELGHVTVGAPWLAGIPLTCGCGVTSVDRPHLEAVASGTGMVKLFMEYKEGNAGVTRCEEIFDLADGGRLLAISIVEHAISAMAEAIANTIHVFNPDIVVIGGGISHQGERVFVPLRGQVDMLLMNEGFHVPIVPALLDEPGLWGALYLALKPPKRIDNP